MQVSQQFSGVSGRVPFSHLHRGAVWTDGGTKAVDMCDLGVPLLLKNSLLQVQKEFPTRYLFFGYQIGKGKDGLCILLARTWGNRRDHECMVSGGWEVSTSQRGDRV